MLETLPVELNNDNIETFIAPIFVLAIETLGVSYRVEYN